MFPTEEPCDLMYTILWLKGFYRSPGCVFITRFLDQIMMMPHACDLRQMRDAEDLMA